MAVRSAGNVVVTYNGQNITAYLNEAELSATIDELESTNLASTAMQYQPSLANYTMSFSGDWSAALDAIIGPDMITPVMRTVSIQFIENSVEVTYTWTSNAFLTGFTITSSATDKITHAPALRLSGAPTRVVT